MTACAASLGKRRSFYATRDTVEDLDELRAALGVKKLTIDGVSYGSFVAERYALAHPERVKALVLDSVLPHADPRGDIPFYLVGLRATARVLRAACGSCGFDPAADIAWLVRHGVDGVKLFDLIVAYEFADPDYAGVLSAIHAARKGDRNPLLGLETSIHQASRRADRVLQRGPPRGHALLRPAVPVGHGDDEPAGVRHRPPGHAPRAGDLAVHAGDRRRQRDHRDLQELAGDAGAAARSRRGSRPSRCSSSAATAISRRRTSGRGRRPRSRRRGSS